MGIFFFPCSSVSQRQISNLVELSGNCSVKHFVLENAGLPKPNLSMGTERGTEVRNSAETLLDSENHLRCDCSTHLRSLSTMCLHSQGH